MFNRVCKLLCLGALLLLIALPSRAQNTKGDKPVDRETRFKKSNKKQKPAKRVKSKRTTSSLRKYRPRKQARGGERAGRPLGPVYDDKPSDRPRNVYPSSGRYVNNSSKKPRRIERSSIAERRISPRITSRSARSNVYPQSGLTNYSSTAKRKPPRKKRINPRSVSRPFIQRRSINAWANFPRPRQKKEKAYKGDISGRRIRTKNFETRRPPIVRSPSISRTRSGRIKSGYPRTRTLSVSSVQKRRNVYSSRGLYVNNRSRSGKIQKRGLDRTVTMPRSRSGDHRSAKRISVVPRSASQPFLKRRSTNVWAHFPRPKRRGERAYTKDIAGKRLRTKNFETQRPDVLINPTSRIEERRRHTGDRPYKGPAAGEHRTRTRTGKAWRGDITHRRIRKNFSSKKGIEGQPVVTPEKRGIGMRDQGEGFSGSLKFKRRQKGGGSISGRRWNNQGQPLPVLTPGIGGRDVDRFQGNIRLDRRVQRDQGEEYSGNIKARRPAKGGGSVSGGWNNRGKAITGRAPGIGARSVDRYQGNIRSGRKAFQDQGEEYSGNIKARRPPKGGGSVSGRWNNNGRPIEGRTPGIGAGGIDRYQGNLRFGRKTFQDQGEEYTGNIKARRPAKGGGSISGRWNNNGRPIEGRTPGIGARGIDRYQGNVRFGRKTLQDQGEEYTGNMKARKPVKGGGSISGSWNNNGRPIEGRTPGIGARGIDRYQGNLRFGRKTFQDQGEEYTGNIKARKPVKGGGSISGSWNNNGRPIEGRTPGIGARGIDRYQGNLRFGRKTFQDQGEEYTGNIKAKKPVKGGGSVSGKLWNNNETPIPVRAPKSDQGAESTGKIKGRKYVRNPNAADESLRKQKPSAETYAVGNLQVRVKRPDYARRNGAPEGSLSGIKPSAATAKAYEYTGRTKQNWKYVRNPNSADRALKTREPGKAFARATDYQGNIKFRKYELFRKSQLHPDAQFVKTNRNNVDGEKDMLTNFKLWWARLFRKNETQPDHLKDREHKPRYDKGEAGLWYD